MTENNEVHSKSFTLNGNQNYIGMSGKSMKGCCGFFISNELSSISREDLNISHSDNNSEFEANWIEIETQNKKEFWIAVIYPSSKKKK